MRRPLERQPETEVPGEVADRKRINVSLPVSLLREVDRLAGAGRGSRNRVIMEAMTLYLAEARKSQFVERLKAGYQEMASLNLTLAEEGLGADSEVLPRAFRWPAGAE